MKSADLCPRFETGMELLSKRWNGFIIFRLLEGSQRFSELESSLPISGRLLSERLKELEAAGITTRTVYPDTPVRIEYELTEKGRALRPVITSIKEWAEKWVNSEELDSMNQ
ncbi:transcriptional regulator, HxlR family [Terribacillus aidingensis]|uniref:Transcriptional regulator, HxlR family n=1 Tax=Terribacillus aidingensis TaxID=586416 RepID=A0A285P705_9BACI|nr:helix-turn-helix domain-containing protein [Terribacillus aidingensis]SNZ17047.1 transcriptional regulator, HxlR family [Terribacillus aidingensis]